MSDIKIITSNIRYANPADGPHDWPHRLPLLTELYQNFSPDILATQEGRIGQIKELDEQLTNLTLIDSHREWIDVRMYPCLFVNLKKIKVLRSGDIWLSETPDVPGSSSFSSSFPRLCTWAEVEIIKTNKKLLIANVHLDHILNETRTGQVAVLIAELKKLGDQNIFIMGDFNESPQSQIKNDLMNAFNLKDPWVEKNYKEETSHHGFNGNEAAEGSRIDWILMPAQFECSYLHMEKRSFNNVFPSDHYPMFATVIPK